MREREKFFLKGKSHPLHVQRMMETDLPFSNHHRGGCFKQEYLTDCKSVGKGLMNIRKLVQFQNTPPQQNSNQLHRGKLFNTR